MSRVRETSSNLDEWGIDVSIPPYQIRHTNGSISANVQLRCPATTKDTKTRMKLTWTERKPRHVTDEGVDEYIDRPTLDEHLHRLPGL